MGGGQWAWAMDGERWAVDSGQWISLSIHRSSFIAYHSSFILPFRWARPALHHQQNTRTPSDFRLLRSPLFRYNYV
ncbi:MAG: hypothetical protein M5U34_07635 [Chloroflexi bacterium]|nr:hypothetical protein [Chloroflexota bacterium]